MIKARYSVIFLFCLLQQTILPNICDYAQDTFDVDFHVSMRFNPNYDLQHVIQDSQWQQLFNLYNEYCQINISCKPKRIPKIIHHIWLGNSLPEKCKYYIQTWKRCHPNWEFKLWTDDDIEKFGLENKKMYDATSNYGEKSDIARYEILYRFGGLYVDTDFECLKPHDILHHCFDFYVGITYANKANILNGLIGSVPGHPILRECIRMMHRPPNAKDTFDQILKRTGPAFFSSCFIRKIAECDGPVVAFPSTYFYPWPWQYRDDRDMNKIRRWIQPESFAIHHWHVSWNNGKVR